MTDTHYLTTVNSGQGDLSVSVQVSANAFSGSAREKIEAAGGTATVV